MLVRVVCVPAREKISLCYNSDLVKQGVGTIEIPASIKGR